LEPPGTMAHICPNQQPERFSAKISEEINCSICLDILVRPQTLVPCGHSFCRGCCTSDHQLCFDKCPQCRQPVEGMVPSRQLENLIETLVMVPNLLFKNDDDKEHYMKRKKIENETKCEIQSRKRPRHNGWSSHSGSNSGSHSISSGDPQYSSYHDSHTRQETPANWFRLHPHTGNHTDFYDHMVAPLPPPYDFRPVPVFNSGLSVSTSGASRVRMGSRAGFTERTHSGSHDYCITPGGTSGISATDPICID